MQQKKKPCTCNSPVFLLTRLGGVYAFLHLPDLPDLPDLTDLPDLPEEVFML